MMKPAGPAARFGKFQNRPSVASTIVSVRTSPFSLCHVTRAREGVEVAAPLVRQAPARLSYASGFGVVIGL